MPCLSFIANPDAVPKGVVFVFADHFHTRELVHGGPALAAGRRRAVWLDEKSERKEQNLGIFIKTRQHKQNKSVSVECRQSSKRAGGLQNKNRTYVAFLDLGDKYILALPGLLL